jgi:hypothetical protein
MCPSNQHTPTCLPPSFRPAHGRKRLRRSAVDRRSLTSEHRPRQTPSGTMRSIATGAVSFHFALHIHQGLSDQSRGARRTLEACSSHYRLSNSDCTCTRRAHCNSERRLEAGGCEGLARGWRRAGEGLWVLWGSCEPVDLPQRRRPSIRLLGYASDPIGMAGCAILN